MPRHRALARMGVCVPGGFCELFNFGGQRQEIPILKLRLEPSLEDGFIETGAWHPFARRRSFAVFDPIEHRELRGTLEASQERFLMPGRMYRFDNGLLLPPGLERLRASWR